jgi:hypothetical protein
MRCIKSIPINVSKPHAIDVPIATCFHAADSGCGFGVGGVTVD